MSERENGNVASLHDRMEENNELSSLKKTAEDDQLPELTITLAEDTVDTRCGYTASCKPSFLQKFANPKAYLFVISACSIIQGFAVNGINNVNIASYERRYLLSSKDSSLVASFYDVAAGITVLFVGYFGGTAHQPRYLGCGVVAIALGTFVMSLAHFSAPPYQPAGGLLSTCMTNGVDNGVCSSSSGDNAFLQNYLYVLLLGQALNGFGGTCLYSLGVTYLDQSVSAKMAPLYIGIMAGSSILGPAMGYILGGTLLSIYVDYPASPPEWLTSSDPGWVGAWWLGFILSSVFAIILAAFMFLFPHELPGTAAIRAAKVSEAHHSGVEDKVNSAGFGIGWRDIPKASWYMIKNPPYMCITAVVGIEIAIAAGFSTFLPKYISNQFAQSGSWAAILTGLLAVPGAALGQLTGGYLCKRFQLKLLDILKMTTISSTIVLVLTPIFWARCSDTNMAGLLAAYPGNAISSQTNLTSTCNTGCGCSTKLYNPVCADDIQYFSPCYAGCLSPPTTDDEGNKIYTNCTCPSGTVDFPAGSVANSTTVTSGVCAVDCQLYYVFIPVAFLIFFFTFLIGAPLTVATLRVVPEKQRAFGVSLQWVFLRFLGSIPGPIIFGSMIDASCSLWDDDCELRGSCWVYNNFDMSKRFFILVVVLKMLSIGFNILACFVYKPPPSENDDKKSETNSMERLNDKNENNSSTAEIIPSKVEYY